MTLLNIIILTIVISVLMVGAEADSSSNNPFMSQVDRILRGGRGSGGRSSSSTSSSSRSSGSSRGSSRTFTSSKGTRTPIKGSCCVSLCCSSGYHAGHTMYWYRGYRPTSEEGEVMDDIIEKAAVEAQSLAELQPSDSILTRNCAAQSFQETLKQSLNATNATNNFLETLNATDEIENDVSEASPGYNGTQTELNTTLQEELWSLSSRLSTIKAQKDVEVDMRDDLIRVVNDYRRLKLCLWKVYNESDVHQAQVNKTTSSFVELHNLTKEWEYVLKSNAFSFSAASFTIIFGSILSTMFLYL